MLHHVLMQVALASGEGPFVGIVRQAQIGINMSDVVCVDANGLPLETDHLHLTTQAQVRLGKMLADAYLSHASYRSGSIFRETLGENFKWALLKYTLKK